MSLYDVVALLVTGAAEGRGAWGVAQGCEAAGLQGARVHGEPRRPGDFGGNWGPDGTVGCWGLELPGSMCVVLSLSDFLSRVESKIILLRGESAPSFAVQPDFASL